MRLGPRELGELRVHLLEACGRASSGAGSVPRSLSRARSCRGGTDRSAARGAGAGGTRRAGSGRSSRSPAARGRVTQMAMSASSMRSSAKWPCPGPTSMTSYSAGIERTRESQRALRPARSASGGRIGRAARGGARARARWSPRAPWRSFACASGSRADRRRRREPEAGVQVRAGGVRVDEHDGLAELREVDREVLRDEVLPTPPRPPPTTTIRRAPRSASGASVDSGSWKSGGNEELTRPRTVGRVARNVDPRRARAAGSSISGAPSISRKMRAFSCHARSLLPADAADCTSRGPCAVPSSSRCSRSSRRQGAGKARCGTTRSRRARA